MYSNTLFYPPTPFSSSPLSLLLSLHCILLYCPGTLPSPLPSKDSLTCGQRVSNTLGSFTFPLEVRGHCTACTFSVVTCIPVYVYLSSSTLPLSPLFLSPSLLPLPLIPLPLPLPLSLSLFVGILRCLTCTENWVAVGNYNGTINTLDIRMGEFLHYWKPSDYSVVQVRRDSQWT